jgi:hypothetical protein
VPVVVANLLASIDGKPFPGRYEGYGSCLLTVAYGKIVLRLVFSCMTLRGYCVDALSKMHAGQASLGHNGRCLPTLPRHQVLERRFHSRDSSN